MKQSNSQSGTNDQLIAQEVYNKFSTNWKPVVGLRVRYKKKLVTEEITLKEITLKGKHIKESILTNLPNPEGIIQEIATADSFFHEAYVVKFKGIRSPIWITDKNLLEPII